MGEREADIHSLDSMSNASPRLMLISDVPVCKGSRSGSEALARLLYSYPAERLMIAQTQGALPSIDRRLPGVTYQSWSMRWDRLLRTRVSRSASILKSIHHNLLWRPRADAARIFGPDAILTLVHGNGWLMASRVAEALRIPLHLIVHDGPTHYQLNDPLIGPWLTREFSDVCMQAASRWSICRALDQHITEKTGVPGDVLPPLRAPNDTNSPVSMPMANLFNAGYFGGLSSVSIAEMMNALSDALVAFGGQLHAHGGVSPNVVKSSAWKNRKFEYHGAFSNRDAFLDHCRRSYRLMYLPFSFSDENTCWSFPSKLIDYTLTGLPILAHAPARSPLGMWCRDNPDAVILVDRIEPHVLNQAVQKLAASTELQLRLARGAQGAGERDFAFEPNFRRFMNAISEASVASQALSS
jgi:hypothetical protein